MREQSTDTVDKAVCTEESGAARLEAVLVALVERKARALHAEQSRTHPLLLLLRHLPEEETSIIGSPGEELPSHWCEHEIARHKRKKLKLQTHRNKEHGPEQLEVDRRRKRRRRRKHAPEQKPRKHRTLLVSAIDEQAKVIHVLDPDELPRRARYTIMVTACLLLFLCLLLVGVTLRMAPLIDDMGGLIELGSTNPLCNIEEKKQVPVKFSTQVTEDILQSAAECVDDPLEFVYSLKAVKAGKIEMDDNFKDFIFCAYVKSGYADKKTGRIFAEHSASIYPGTCNILKVFQECDKKSCGQPAGADTLFEFFKCFQTKSPCLIDLL